MIQGQGAFSWEAARQFAIAVASEGESEPNVDPLARIDLEQLIRVAELHVAQATGLNPSGSGRPLEALPVTRALWAHQTIEAYRPLFEDLAADLSASDQADEDPSADFFGGLMKMMTPMMLGVTAGSMVGHLAQRAFGQYDLPIPRAASHQLLVVPTNLDRFAGDWSLPVEDLRLWVCLSEVTTHAVLNVPHVRARMTDASSCRPTNPTHGRSKIASVASTSAIRRAWRACSRRSPIPRCSSVRRALPPRTHWCRSSTRWSRSSSASPIM